MNSIQTAGRLLADLVHGFKNGSADYNTTKAVLSQLLEVSFENDDRRLQIASG